MNPLVTQCGNDWDTDDSRLADKVATVLALAQAQASYNQALLAWQGNQSNENAQALAVAAGILSTAQMTDAAAGAASVTARNTLWGDFGAMQLAKPRLS